MRRTIRPTDPGIFDYQNHVERLARSKTTLDSLNDLIDWDSFRPIISKAFKKTNPNAGGRPAFDVIFMFKVLVLQRIHNLSDEATEQGVMERLTWHRFLDVHVGSAFPDKNTIWDFKQALIQADTMRLCFEAFFTQIAQQGVRLESGKIIDATFVEVPVQHNTVAENAQIKAGETPPAWKKPTQRAKLRQKDVDARWTQKGGRRHFGYKNHVKIDQESKIIEACQVTAASEHDSQSVADLIDSTDGRLYGDSAYRSHVIARMLAALNIQNWICERAYRNTPLTKLQQETNRTKSRIRSRVEHVFGTIATSFKGTAQRCIGFQRNAAMIFFTNLVYNMDRLRSLRRAA